MLPKRINSRTIMTPLAAFTMACLVFVYARSSIHAAKRNAALHREADGGQISWGKESLRRHGVIEPPEEQNTVKQLLGVGKNESVEKPDKRDTDQEQILRARAARPRKE